MKLLVSAVIAILISGCTASQMANMSGMPGSITDQVSSFDGQREITMQKSYIRQNSASTAGFNPATMSMGAFWSSKMPKDTIIVDVGVDGTYSIATDESLQFNVDGTMYQFSSVDKRLTDIKVGGSATGGNYSSRQYALTRTFVQKLIDAKDVRVKLILDKTYVTGFFTTENNWGGDARPAFIEYLKRLPN